MPNTDDIQEGYQRAGFGGGLGAAAWDITKWQYSWSTLHMIREGGRAGYYVPWTRVDAKGTGQIANFGMRRGWWGPGGFEVGGKANLASQEIFERAGMRGFKSAGARVAMEASSAWRTELYGQAMARGATARAAGRYATKYAGVMGARSATVAGAKFMAGRIAGFAIPVLNAVMLAEFGATTAITGYQALANKFGKVNVLELGGYFPESQGAYTSRQRAVQAITASQLQARSAIGNEAQLFHR